MTTERHPSRVPCTADSQALSPQAHDDDYSPEIRFMRSRQRLHHAISLMALTLMLSACGASDPIVQADPVRGKQLYVQCAGCHELQANSVGPMHCGLIGRAAGSVPGFDYSDAMKTSGLVWDVRTLDEFLKSPLSYVPGTKMGFAGFHEAADRADVIAYLQQVNNDPGVCPPRQPAAPAS